MNLILKTKRAVIFGKNLFFRSAATPSRASAHVYVYIYICHNIGTWWPFWDTHSIPLGAQFKVFPYNIDN